MRLTGLLLAVVLLTGLTPGGQAAEPWVNATGAIVMDFDTDEVYYEKDADVARPIASMTKVMSLYLVFEEMAAGNLSPDTMVTASGYASAVSNNPIYSGLERLRMGGQYPVDTLIRLITTESCNGSVIALAEHISGEEWLFVQRMNEKAVEWGIEAHFADSCGFEDQGNAVTPRAMAYIAKRIIADYPQILEYTSLLSTVFQGKTFNSTNTLLRNGTCEGIDGLKTGTTDGAGYCFTGTAQRDGRRIISVVMNTTGYSARMSEGKTLLEYGFTCRAEREEQWIQTAGELEVEVSAQGPLWSQAEVELSALVTAAPEEGVFGTVTWEVDGVPLEGSEGRLLRKGDTVTAPFTVPAGEEAVAAAMVLTLSDGTQVRREAKLKRPEEDMVLEGRLGLRQVEMYPETTLVVPFQVRLDRNVHGVMAAGWYLDGFPIPYYQNSAFRVGPEGKTSSYTLRGEDLTPGRHVLEFRCNTEGLPWIQEANFTLDILVLSEEDWPITGAVA